MVSVRLPEHSHCKYCGDPIPFGNDYCDETCRNAEIQREKKEKMKDVMFYASAGIVIVVMIAAKFIFA